MKNGPIILEIIWRKGCLRRNVKQKRKWSSTVMAILEQSGRGLTQRLLLNDTTMHQCKLGRWSRFPWTTHPFFLLWKISKNVWESFGECTYSRRSHVQAHPKDLSCPSYLLLCIQTTAGQGSPNASSVQWIKYTARRLVLQCRRTNCHSKSLHFHQIPRWLWYYNVVIIYRVPSFMTTLRLMYTESLEQENLKILDCKTCKFPNCSTLQCNPS